MYQVPQETPSLVLRETPFLVAHSSIGIELLSNNKAQSNPIPNPIEAPFFEALSSHVK